MSKWIFLEKRADRSATGDAFRNSFEGEDVVQILARESIQNSVDALVDGETLKVRYSKLEGLDLRQLLTNEYLGHLKASGVHDEFDPQKAEALFVEDFGTSGLTGSMTALDSNFYQLMGQLGGSPKEGGQGGSFGYGKAACILNSRCWTVIAYTITEDGSALFGTTYMDQHKRGNESYTGLGWFCAEGSEGSHPRELTGESADELAKTFKFTRANTRELGTSLMVLYPTIQLEELRYQIELFWWPRLTDHNLYVELKQGGKTYVPMPSSNSQTKEFVELYETIQKTSGVKPGDVLKSLNYQSRKIGDLAMGIRTSIQDTEIDENEKTGSIALMRNQRMVVEYYRWTQGPRRDLIGVFVADPSVNNDLRKTESPKHDVWSPKATRASEDQRKLAWQVLDRIRKEHKAYISQYNPPASNDDQVLSELRKFFGSLLSTQGKSGGSSKAEPISIVNQSAKVVPHGNELRLVGGADIKWKGRKSSILTIGLEVQIANSDVSTTGDPIPVNIHCCGQKIHSDKPHFEMQVTPNDTVRLEFESDSYDPTWTSTAVFKVSEVINLEN